VEVNTDRRRWYPGAGLSRLIEAQDLCESEWRIYTDLKKRLLI